jgi:hypothetical protein
MSYSKPQYSITYRGPEKLVELTWLPETQSMTDQDFKDVGVRRMRSATQRAPLDY